MMKIHSAISGLVLLLWIVDLGCAQVALAPEGPPPRPPGDPIDSLCDPDAVIPDLITCGTCENRCGALTNPKSVETHQPKDTCACDESCGYYGDCCSDFQQFCPTLFQAFQADSAVYPATLTPSRFNCVSFYNGYGMYSKSLVVRTCADSSECQYSSTLNEDANTFVPMFDPNTGVHYISAYCALCNDVKEVQPWSASVYCGGGKFLAGPGAQGPDFDKDTKVINNTDTLSDVVESNQCTLTFVKHAKARDCRYSNSLTSSCPDSCQNERLKQQCESGPQDYLLYAGEEGVTGGYGTYRNPACVACNAPAGATTGGLVCGIHEERFEVSAFFPRDPNAFSLTLVFDFNPRRGLTVGKHGIPECDVGEVYVPDEDACRPITCPSGFVLDKSDCIPEPSNITAIVSGKLSSPVGFQTAGMVPASTDTLKGKIADSFNALLASYRILKSGDVDVHIALQRTSDGIEVRVNFECNCDYSALYPPQDDGTNSANGTSYVTQFEDDLRMEVQEDIIEYLMQENVDLETVKAQVQSDLDAFTAASDPTRTDSDCTWLVYQANETEFSNGSIKVISTGRTYPMGSYQLLEQNGVIIVCETGPLGPGGNGDETNAVDLALSLLTLVLVGLSILCLLARLILQWFVSSFHNRPGRLQFMLTLAMLLAFIFLIIGPFVSDHDDACVAMAIILVYCFLATFVWMNVIAIDTWVAFKSSSAFSRADEMGKSLFIHVAIGWGIPLVLVSISIAMNFVDGVDSRFTPEFGGSRCWYTQRYAMLVYFGIPIALSILINIGLYIHTAVNLRRAFKHASTLSKSNDYHFGIYVRLFVLMGLTWIFGFISAFTEEVVIDFIFVILTSLQGVFLFISFVCNRRVLSELNKKIRGVSSMTSSSQGKGTKSTPVSGGVSSNVSSV